MKKYFTKALSLMLTLALVLSMGAVNAFAAEKEDSYAEIISENALCFANIDSMSVGEKIEVSVVDRNGDPAVVGIEKIAPPNDHKILPGKASSSTYKVYYTGVVINCRFYMTVSNNQVTSVYDDWILIIGGSYDDDSLTRTSTYGKLSFKVTAYAGIMSAKCWLKGTVTGSGNDITVSYQM